MKSLAPSRVGFSGPVSNYSKLALLSFALTCVSVPAFAADTWIACEGTVATKMGSATATTEPANDFYAYNDDINALYKYSPKRQSLDMISVSGYDAKAITWKTVPRGVGAELLNWEGSLDRGKMSLNIVREEGEEVMTWTQQCKPASAQTLK